MRTGLERLVAKPTLLAGSSRIGLITNPTGVLPDLTPGPAALLAAGLPLTALFSPEHGLRGTAQAGFGESGGPNGADDPGGFDPATGLPVFDAYLKEGPALDALVASARVDTLLFDIADVGTRFYTYVWTMYDLMESAARLGLRFAVLDRPNPLGGTIAEGPLLDPGHASFVGRAPIPVRHGLTAGELAGYVNRDLGADLHVVELEGWRRHDGTDGLPWVMPSVNMPTPDTALVYPGTALFEGTNLSEGRGTTKPFELVGAPWLDERFAGCLNAMDLPGVRFRDTWFTPAFHKHAGTPVRGVQVHVTDPEVFRPVLTGAAMLHLAHRLAPERFTWQGAEEITSGASHFVDLLWGSADLRRSVEAGGAAGDLCPPPAHPRGWAGDGTLLYA
ncbi:hypothetical protein Ssi02_17850 [Sinosporangium siamense]|uniref:DUF1343 domain-containing protein n=1 Tax=Sinosporangium siamense TaxID=1367973 RepID=A0A919RGS8_9ACTN|nr:hypothetical protein Ssi02_17850 [Sinosporangium siamense]